MNGKIETRWHTKQCNVCKRSSDLDEETKENMIFNMVNKIKELASEDKKKVELKEKLRKQLRKIDIEGEIKRIGKKDKK